MTSSPSIDSRLTVGSLFAGIGGWDLGLERTGGFRTVWFCEQDEFCQHVLAEHWPGVPCHPDVTELRGADVEPVDVLCGGFPCQDLSYAGKGAGLAGARSGLWSEYARLIGELGPRYVLVENVTALLARGLGVVLADLAAIGYDAEWDCIPAAAFGAPHRRDRIWLVAYPNAARPGLEGTGVRGRSADLRAPAAVADAGREGRRQVAGGAHEDEGEDAGRSATFDHVAGGAGTSRLRAAGAGDVAALADATGERRGSGDLARADVVNDGPEPSHGDARARRDGDGWLTEPDVGRVADGVPARVDRLRSLGNALVPQIAQWIGQRVLDHENAVKGTYELAS